MRYLITVPAGARRTSAHTFAVESAFAQHLRELKHELGARFDEIIVAMAYLDDAAWAPVQGELTVIDEAQERIRFVPLHRFGCTKLEFARACPRLLPQMARLVKASDFVHSHFSYDLFRPIGAWFCLFAAAMRKPIIAVDDIDRRRDAEMFYRTGRWDKRTYLTCKHVYDPLRDWLQRAYVRHIDMMLFKELQQVRDFGRGAQHVRLFLDPNFSREHVIDSEALTAKQRRLSDRAQPLRALYFGRLVPYKGVDKMIDAVAQARARGARLTIDIMGSGQQQPALRAQCERLGLERDVQFIAPREYGPAFFDVLRDHDLLLACPLSGDTPRSAWDALASGLPLVAFDTPFYASLSALSQAVELTPWPQVEPLADKLFELADEKTRLVPLVRNAVETARNNTGESWLERRVQWVDELLQGRPRHSAMPTAVSNGSTIAH